MYVTGDVLTYRPNSSGLGTLFAGTVPDSLTEADFFSFHTQGLDGPRKFID